MTNEKITFAKEYNGIILIRYYAYKHEGLMLIDIRRVHSAIRTMNTLWIAGSGHIRQLQSIEAYVPSELPQMVFIPNLSPETISNDAEFIQGYQEQRKYWHIDLINAGAFRNDCMIATELLFMNVYRDRVSFTGLPYDNSFFNTRFYSSHIRLAEIGI